MLLMVLSFFPSLTNPITPLFDTVEGAESVEFAAASLDVEDEDEAILQRFSVVEFCRRLKEEDSWLADLSCCWSKVAEAFFLFSSSAATLG